MAPQSLAETEREPYPRHVLAVLAAIVPILGALYAAGSYLVTQSGVAHEYRVRRRLIPIRDERFHRLLPEAKARAERMGREFDMDVFIHQLDEMDEVLYTANGVSMPPSIRFQSLVQSMSAPIVPREERRRQWVLLLTSAAGLFLLALDSL